MKSVSINSYVTFNKSNPFIEALEKVLFMGGKHVTVVGGSVTEISPNEKSNEWIVAGKIFLIILFPIFTLIAFSIREIHRNIIIKNLSHEFVMLQLKNEYNDIFQEFHSKIEHCTNSKFYTANEDQYTKFSWRSEHLHKAFNQFVIKANNIFKRKIVFNLDYMNYLLDSANNLAELLQNKESILKKEDPSALIIKNLNDESKIIKKFILMIKMSKSFKVLKSTDLPYSQKVKEYRYIEKNGTEPDKLEALKVLTENLSDNDRMKFYKRDPQAWQAEELPVRPFVNEPAGLGQQAFDPSDEQGS